MDPNQFFLCINMETFVNQIQAFAQNIEVAYLLPSRSLGKTFFFIKFD